MIPLHLMGIETLGIERHYTHTHEILLFCVIKCLSYKSSKIIISKSEHINFYRIIARPELKKSLSLGKGLMSQEILNN